MLASRGVNADTPAEQAQDPSNAMAGFDVRLRCRGTVRCAVYGQLIGENATRSHPRHSISAFTGFEHGRPTGGTAGSPSSPTTMCGGCSSTTR